jgi:hypothetical protein
MRKLALDFAIWVSRLLEEPKLTGRCESCEHNAGETTQGQANCPSTLSCRGATVSTGQTAAWKPGGKPPEKKESKNIFPRMCLVFGPPDAYYTCRTGAAIFLGR